MPTSQVASQVLTSANQKLAETDRPGEMQHHDVLAAKASGTSVVLCASTPDLLQLTTPLTSLNMLSVPIRLSLQHRTTLPEAPCSKITGGHARSEQQG